MQRRLKTTAKAADASPPADVVKKLLVPDGAKVAHPPATTAPKANAPKANTPKATPAPAPASAVPEAIVKILSPLVSKGLIGKAQGKATTTPTTTPTASKVKPPAPAPVVAKNVPTSPAVKEQATAKATAKPKTKAPVPEKKGAASKGKATPKPKAARASKVRPLKPKPLPKAAKKAKKLRTRRAAKAVAKRAVAKPAAPTTPSNDAKGLLNAASIEKLLKQVGSRLQPHTVFLHHKLQNRRAAVGLHRTLLPEATQLPNQRPKSAEPRIVRTANSEVLKAQKQLVEFLSLLRNTQGNPLAPTAEVFSRYRELEKLTAPARNAVASGDAATSPLNEVRDNYRTIMKVAFLNFCLRRLKGVQKPATATK